MDTTLIALSSFGHLCEELDILQSNENISELQTSSNIGVMMELAAEATRFTAGEISNCMSVYLLSIWSGCLSQFNFNFIHNMPFTIIIHYS